MRQMNANLRSWQELSPQEQCELREAYGHYLDSLPPTCDMAEKVERFSRWLADQGVEYPPPS